MRLKKLKLAGFKSFVDPTVISFPSQLVAIVGPNGCGKSNVMDAVRWVMGESSARYLRMESMVDVIFNGASNRQPVGQASVELVFENDKGKLSGQYASYQEVALKRVVTRDGDSTYFLNGTRCRRRDINDLFLGTGAGARGYAIIGQEMITRLIEARPEELRAYLEEAAGVSKYKERRRETLNRITQTRENLDRVNDIRDELGKQLARLERQARVAKRYQQLREEERQHKAEILALKWQAHHQAETAIQCQIQEEQVLFEGYQSQLASLNSEQIQHQTLVHDTNQQLQITQNQYYQLGNEMVRLEEAIHQKRQEKERLAKDQNEAEKEITSVNALLQEDASALEKSKHNLISLEESLKTLEQAYEKLLEFSKALQKKRNLTKEKWHFFQSEQNSVQHGIEKLVLRQQHIDSRRQDTINRIEKIQINLAEYDVVCLEQELERLQKEEHQYQEKQVACKETYEQAQNHSQSLRHQISAKEKALREAQKKEQVFFSEHAALKAAQQAAMAAKSSELRGTKWENFPRLLDILQVDKPWQEACEFVLSEMMYGVFLESMQDALDDLSSLSNYSISFISVRKEKIDKNTPPTLLDKLHGVIPACAIDLNQVFVVEDIEQARALLPRLSANQSVLTKAGVWMGPGWIKIKNTTPKANQESLLSRKSAIDALEKKWEIARKETTIHLEETETLHERYEMAVQQEDACKKDLSEASEQLTKTRLIRQQKEQLFQEYQLRVERLHEEIANLQEGLESLAGEQVEIQEKLEALQEKDKQNQGREEQLREEMQDAGSNWENIKDKLESARALLHEKQLQFDREKFHVEQLNDRIERENQRLMKLTLRLNELEERMKSLGAFHEDMNKPLAEKNEKYLELEAILSQQRDAVASTQNQIEEISQAIKQKEIEVKAVEEQIQKYQLEVQALKVKAAGHVETLAEMDVCPESLLAGIPQPASLSTHEQMLETIVEKIKRLGAINLVAIEEYETENQRKQHLDEQHEDLINALQTLEQAIIQMDQETQARLQAAYEQVDAAFQSLFPRLFGGGRAKLQLTCDNLLEAGVLVMAQPPGKRNSTLQMLSGGEKAMTAIALVFAIFQLNPAPFCLLDEVDAPLDDANVRRFCGLVKELSQYVQFLFITHNKVTMELADQLIGVTMREPGVSRIVSVDVEDAMLHTDMV